MSDEDNDEIIETSEQAEDEGKGGLYPYDPTKADIDIREAPHSVFELMRKYDQQRLIVDPDFQRNLVWKREQQSRFIESIILNFPLPPLYVNETREGKYIVVDGLQRITALHQFLNNKFPLQGLEALPRLNNNNFDALKQMAGAYQTKVEDKKILLYVLRPSVPLTVVYDLFNRINTGGTPLERHEVRNCIFLGNATKLLKELSESETFRVAIDNGISPKRMKDREVVLRYLSFKIKRYQSYASDMSSFIEEVMRDINKMTTEEILALKDDFYRAMRLTYDFFRENNFRIPFTKKDKVTREDKVTRGRINIAVLESVGFFFSQQTEDFLIKNKEVIKNNFFNRLLKNEKYLDAVQKSTGDKNRVTLRFELAQEILGDVSHDNAN